ncbi:MAG: glycosyltransferase family 39 protein, partial [Gemmataceae bacterium]|nr:glycosyltransferase family 39 protein [Gemmataceae bacterium]
AILAGWASVLFFYGLSGSELWRTEGLRARVAQEMLANGNWLLPCLYGEPFFTKPLGMYFAIVVVSWPFGSVSTITARLPSALAATACVFLFAWYFRRRLGPIAGLVAGLILPMAPMWIDKASAAEIDMLLTFWVLASIVCFLRATETRHEQGSFGWWLIALLCVAAGFLTKWTAPQFFYGMSISYLWWTGRLRLLFAWRHVVSLTAAIAVVVAWITVIYWHGHAHVLRDTMLWEGLSRFAPGYNTYRPYPWLESLYHPLKILLNTLPWSALAVLALCPSFYRGLDANCRDLLAALHCWVWPQVLFWSLPNEHTPRHSFPLFPGVAGLAVVVWHAWRQQGLPWPMPRLPPPKVVAGLLAVWCLAKVAYVEVIMSQRTHIRQPRNKAAVLAALVPSDETLYTLLVRDEGIMFYYGRPIVRVDEPEQLPQSERPIYFLVNQPAWRHWRLHRRAELVHRLDDEQGDALYLVRVF